MTEPRVATRRRAIPWDLVAGIAAVFLLIGPAVRSPHYVPRLTLVNPTPYSLSFDVTNRAHEGWMAVVVVPGRTTQIAQDVVDQGSDWIFRVHGQGASGGEFAVTKAELRRAKWHVTVPTDAEARLRAGGATPDVR
jgi:hypothetical protein